MKEIKVTTIEDFLKKNVALILPEPKISPVPINEYKQNYPDVGFWELAYAWFFYNLKNELINLTKGDVMENKSWFKSKTIWFNILSAIWFLLGPAIGIPTLDADTFAAILMVVNLILRVITKGAVTIN